MTADAFSTLATDRRPAGLILAGGRARRMGGGDKPLLALGDRSILARVVERLAPQCATLAISANGDPRRFAPFPAAIVADHGEDEGAGPLAGILAGLDHHAAHGAATVLVVAGDMPFLPPDLAVRLAAAQWSDRKGVAAVRRCDRRHPLASLWRVSGRQALRQMLRQDKLRRVEAVMDRLGAIWVDWPAGTLDPFTNINTPADLAAATMTASAWET